MYSMPTEKTMQILISNDDGVYAPGLNILADTLRHIAEIIVVAPDRDRSGASNSLTLDTPLRAHELENGFICVQGTPTDCVHLAITGLLPTQPSMVVSGINLGANLGDDILYSGTVAAATEGRFLGLPAIAISLVGKQGLHFHTAAHVAKQLVLRLLEDPLPADTILNVNIPDVPLEEIKGYEVTRLGKRHCAEKVIESKDPRGRKIFWIGAAGPEQDAGPGTDFFAINQNCVSITPLQLDLSCYQAFEQLKKWIANLDK